MGAIMITGKGAIKSSKKTH